MPRAFVVNRTALNDHSTQKAMSNNYLIAEITLKCLWFNSMGLNGEFTHFGFNENISNSVLMLMPPPSQVNTESVHTN